MCALGDLWWLVSEAYASDFEWNIFFCGVTFPLRSFNIQLANLGFLCVWGSISCYFFFLNVQHNFKKYFFNLIIFFKTKNDKQIIIHVRPQFFEFRFIKTEWEDKFLNFVFDKKKFINYKKKFKKI